jgi:hypothetical protein
MGSQKGNLVGFVDARESPASAANNNSAQIADERTYGDEASLDARLTAISATTYTVARLQQMTRNDKVYAVRVSDDAASILGA